MVTVALVDDHAVVRQGLRVLLESDPEFVVVGEAANGSEALALVKRQKPEVLVADLVMPGMDGLETTRKVMRLKLTTRVVILTMYGDMPYLLDALASGASAYLVKESCADDLFQAIREVVAGRYYLSPALSQDCRRYLQKFRTNLLRVFPTLATRSREALQRALLSARRGASRNKSQRRQKASFQGSADASGRHLGGESKENEDDSKGKKRLRITARQNQILQLLVEGKTTRAVGAALNITDKTVDWHRANLMVRLNCHSVADLARYAIRTKSSKPESTLA